MEPQDQQESKETADAALIAEVTSIIDEIEIPSSDTDVEISVRKLDEEQRFVAVLEEWETGGVRGREIGTIRYRIEGDHQVDVYSTYVRPEFRGRGITGDFLADVLDRLRDTGMQVTESCPVAAAFVLANAAHGA